MKTLEEAFELIEEINADAYQTAYDTWLEADEVAETDEDAAEELREQASEDQSEFFRNQYEWMPEEDKKLIEYWLKHDEDFREQFLTYYGDYWYEEKDE